MSLCDVASLSCMLFPCGYALRNVGYDIIVDVAFIQNFSSTSHPVADLAPPLSKSCIFDYTTAIVMYGNSLESGE